MRPYTFTFVLILFFTPFVQASVSTQLDLLNEYYPQKVNNTNTQNHFFKVHLKTNTHLKKIKFYFHSWALLHNNDIGETQESHIEISEAFIEYKPTSQSRIRAGLNTYNWGVLDGYSPLDVISSGIYWNPMTPDKRSSLSLETRFETDHSRLDILYIPQQKEALLPGERSRWLPRNLLLNFSSQFGEITLPKDLNYSYKSSEELDHSLKHNFGLRWSYRLEQLDLYISHFEGSANSPQIRPELNIIVSDVITTDPDIKLKPVYYKQRTSGFGLVWFTDQILVRWETAYKHTLSDQDGLTEWGFENGLGLEKNITLLNHSTTLLFQTYYSQYPKLSDNFPIDHSRIFEKSITLGGRMSFTERSSLTLKWLHQIHSPNFAGGINFEGALAESIKYVIGYDFIEGSPSSLLGSFKKNDRGYINLMAYY